MFEIKNDAPEMTDSEIRQPEEGDRSKLGSLDRPEHPDSLSDGGEKDGQGMEEFHSKLTPAGQEMKTPDAANGGDPINERIRSIDSSDMPPDEKRAQYEQLKSELQDAQRRDREPFDGAEDEGAPVRARRLGGSDMARSHPDHWQELSDLDEGVKNMEDFYNGRVSDISSRNERISNDPGLTNREKIAELKNSRDELQRLSKMRDQEYADVYSERERLAGKLMPQDENNV